MSLTFLYFAHTFNVDLSLVGEYNQTTNSVVTLDEIFALINLEDDDIKHKVWKVFDNTSKNEYLGNDILHLAEKNDLRLSKTINKTYLKRLVKK